MTTAYKLLEVFFIGLCIYTLLKAVSAYLKSRKAAKLANNNKSRPRPEVKPLIVGREYWVRDGNKNLVRMVYMGKTVDSRYEFYNLDTGAGISIATYNGKPDNLFVLGDVRWANEQSKLQCPKIEMEGTV